MKLLQAPQSMSRVPAVNIKLSSCCFYHSDVAWQMSEGSEVDDEAVNNCFTGSTYKWGGGVQMCL